MTFVRCVDPMGDLTAMEVLRCRATPGDNLLAAAMRCGAVDVVDAERFCLEGRCDSCVMEMEEDGEMVRACQTSVLDEWAPAVRLVIGDGRAGGEDAFWAQVDFPGESDDGDDVEDGFATETAQAATSPSVGERARVEEEEEDDPFGAMYGGVTGSAWGVAAGDGQEWEQFEGSKYYRE